MQPDELDRLLSEEGHISPSPSFTAAVMSAVRREAATPRSIGFPWKPVVFGIAAAGLSIVAGVGRESAAPSSELLQSWMTRVAADAADPAVNALILSVVVALVPLVVYQGYQRLRD